MDTQGHFQNNLAFNPSEAIFEVRFLQYEGDDDAYRTDMEALHALVDGDNEEAILPRMRDVSDLALKFTLLTSWRGYVEASKGGHIMFMFNAEPYWLFNNNMKLATSIYADLSGYSYSYVDGQDDGNEVGTCRETTSTIGEGRIKLHFDDLTLEQLQCDGGDLTFSKEEFGYSRTDVFGNANKNGLTLGKSNERHSFYRGHCLFD